MKTIFFFSVWFPTGTRTYTLTPNSPLFDSKKGRYKFKCFNRYLSARTHTTTNQFTNKQVNLNWERERKKKREKNQIKPKRNQNKAKTILFVQNRILCKAKQQQKAQSVSSDSFVVYYKWRWTVRSWYCMYTLIYYYFKYYIKSWHGK